MQLLVAANKAYCQSLKNEVETLARAGMALKASEVVDLTFSSASESDWEGDFHGPSHIFYSMQPPEELGATTKRIHSEKGGKYFRIKGPGERDQAQERRLNKVKDISKKIDLKSVADFFTAVPKENQKRPRAKPFSFTALTVESLEAAKKYEKKCKASFDKETTPSQAKLVLSQLGRVQAIVRYIDKYLQAKRDPKHADKTEIQRRTDAAKASGTQTYHVKGDKGVQ